PVVGGWLKRERRLRRRSRPRPRRGRSHRLGRPPRAAVTIPCEVPRVVVRVEPWVRIRECVLNGARTLVRLDVCTRRKTNGGHSLRRPQVGDLATRLTRRCT